MHKQYKLPFIKTVLWSMEIFVMEHNTYIPEAESNIPEVIVEVNYKSVFAASLEETRLSFDLLSSKI
jgi:hypothetical protein